MATENLSTITELHQAFLSRDEDRFLALLDEDVDWQIGAFLTGTASYSGHDGVRAWLAEVRALAEGGEHLTSEFLGDRELEDGRVLSLGRSTIRRAAGDLRTEFAVLYTLAGGKVTAVAHYPTHAEAFENLGIEP